MQYLQGLQPQMTLSEVGAVLGMSKQAVHETEKKALVKLRASLEQRLGDEWIDRIRAKGSWTADPE